MTSAHQSGERPWRAVDAPPPAVAVAREAWSEPRSGASVRGESARGIAAKVVPSSPGDRGGEVRTIRLAP